MKPKEETREGKKEETKFELTLHHKVPKREGREKTKRFLDFQKRKENLV